AHGPDANLVSRQSLSIVDVQRIVARAVLEPDDEARRRPGQASVRRLHEDVLVVEDLAGLPERLVLLVLECDVDGPVRSDRGRRALILVTLARRAAHLERADRGIRAGDLLSLRPALAAVVGMGLQD